MFFLYLINARQKFINAVYLIYLFVLFYDRDRIMNLTTVFMLYSFIYLIQLLFRVQYKVFSKLPSLILTKKKSILSVIKIEKPFSFSSRIQNKKKFMNKFHFNIELQNVLNSKNKKICTNRESNPGQLLGRQRSYR